MTYVKKAFIGLGLAFLTTSTVRYWTQKPAPPVVYVQPVPVPVTVQSPADAAVVSQPKPVMTLEERLHTDIGGALQVYDAR